MLSWSLFAIAALLFVLSIYHAYASARHLAPGKPAIIPWVVWIRDDPTHYTDDGRYHVTRCVRYRLLALPFLVAGFLVRYWSS